MKTNKLVKDFYCGPTSFTSFDTHLVHERSWFRPVMKSVDASMEIGFQVTISESKVQITSNLFSLVLYRSILDINFTWVVAVWFWLSKKAKRSEFDLQDNGETAIDPLLQQAVCVQLEIFSWNINIDIKIFHISHHGPLIFMIYIYQWLQLNTVNWTKFSTNNYSSEIVVWVDLTTFRENFFFFIYNKSKCKNFKENMHESYLLIKCV